jgi:hypothetical protein
MIRRIGVAVACAGALACGLAFAVPAMAQSSAGFVAVVSAGSPKTDAAELSVTLQSSSAVVPSSITAELYASGSTTPALTVTDFSLTTGPNSSTGGTTTWTVSSPITQAELPLGSYTIAVQASDTAGDQGNSTDAGTLAFIVYPTTVTLSASPNPVSYGQTVTLSGTDMGLYPDGTVAPVAGQEIFYTEGATATTDSSGNYSITVGALGNIEVQVQAEANATTAYGLSNEVTVSAITYPTRLTGLSISPATASYPAGVTVSGTVSYEINGEWQPWTDTPVIVSPDGQFVPCPEGETCFGPGPWGATTNDDGAFTIAIPGPIGPDTYELGISDDGPFFAQISTSFKVPADHVGLVSTSMAAALTTSGYVNLYACGQPNTEVINLPDMAPFPRGRFEYAKSKSGPWKLLSIVGSVKSSYGPPTHYSGCYSAKAKAPGQSVYYRLDSTADTAYQSMISAAVQATKPARSYITNYKVSPTSVSAGSQVKVSGVLHIKTSKYVPSQKVRIMFRPAGSSTWTVYKTVSTGGGPPGGGSGFVFSAKIKLHTSGSVAAWFYGTQSAFPCKSRSDVVQVYG